MNSSNIIPNHIQYLIIEYWYQYGSWLLATRDLVQDRAQVFKRRVDLATVSRCWFGKISMLLCSDPNVLLLKSKICIFRPTKDGIEEKLKMMENPYQLLQSTPLLTYSYNSIWSPTERGLFVDSDVSLILQHKQDRLVSLFSSIRYLRIDISDIHDGVLVKYFSVIPVLKELALKSNNHVKKEYIETLDITQRRTSLYKADKYVLLFDTLTDEVTQHIQKLTINIDDESVTPGLERLCQKFSGFSSLKSFHIKSNKVHLEVLSAVIESLPISLESININSNLILRYDILPRLVNLKEIDIRGMDKTDFTKYLMNINNLQIINTRVKVKSIDFFNYIKDNRNIKKLNIKIRQKDKYGDLINSLQPKIQFNPTSLCDLSLYIADLKKDVVSPLLSQLPTLGKLSKLTLIFGDIQEKVLCNIMTEYLVLPQCPLKYLHLFRRIDSVKNDEDSYFKLLESAMVKNRSLVTVESTITIYSLKLLERIIGKKGLINQVSTLEKIFIPVYSHIQDSNAYKVLLKSQDSNHKDNRVKVMDVSSGIIIYKQINI